jgi:hypothetical protein
MPLIDLPDGNQLDVPDNATPEMLMAVRAKLQGMEQFRNASKVQEPAGFIESFGRDLASGFGHGAANIIRGAATAAGAFLPKGNGLADSLNSAAGSAEDYWNEVGSKSTNNSYGQGVARGIGGAATAGAPTPTTLIAGAGAGAGAAMADNLTNGQPNPLLRAGASMLGGVAAGTGAVLAARVRPQSTDVAREALEGITPEQLNSAQAYKNAMAATGSDIDLVQALQATGGHSGNLGSIRNFLAQRSQGDQVQKTLRGQPEQLARQAELTIRSLPGENYSAQQNANNVQQTASDVLAQAQKSRSAAVKDLYAAAGDLPVNARNDLGQILNKFAMQPGATEVLKGKAAEFAQKLLGNDPKLGEAVDAAQAALAAAKRPSERAVAQQALATANGAVQGAKSKPLSALDVNTWIGELAGPWKGQDLKVAYPKEQGQIKGLAGELNQRFQDLSPDVAKAAATFKDITNSTVAPLKQGPIGLLNQAHGADPSTAAMVSKFEKLMNKGTDPTAKVSDIATAVTELGTQDPTAFQDAFKGWVSRKMQGAIELGVGDVPLSKTNPGELYNNLFKDPLQWHGIKDATAGMAKLQGEKPEEVIRGLENLRQLTIAMKNRPEAVGGVSGADLKQLGGSSNVANVVRIASFLPANRLGESIERATFNKTLSQLDTILTSPEGAKMLIELGKVPVMSKKAQVILGTWGAVSGNAPGLQNGNPLE